jgi:glycogen debranching enzyme
MGRAEAAYNPISYHCGSVWPHDTSIAIAGLARAGRRDEAARLTGELLRALASYPERRLPELFAGLGDDATPHPVDYPTANSPQAWAAGAVLLVTAVMLGLDVDVPARRITLAPALPPQVGRVRVFDLEVAGARVQIEVRREGGKAAAEVHGAPPGWTVETAGE